MKNFPTKMTKTRPKMPAIANTKPDATLFCRNDVLALTGIVGGAGIEDDSTTTVVCVTGSGVKELELLSVEWVEDKVEETMETLLDELTDLGCDEVELDDEVALELAEVLLVKLPGSRGSKGPSLGRIPSKA